MDNPLSRPENFTLPGLPLPAAQQRLARMIYVPGGTFRMGSRKGDEMAYGDEHPDHDVTVAPFFIGRFPVTQALWKAVMEGDNPSFFAGDERPVEQVSWERITQEFLPALKELTGWVFRLPTEAEWEYAARGGRHWKDSFQYAGSDKLKEVGWFEDNSHRETKPVGLKAPNQLGLYDMSGNVWEWVQDQWHDDYNGAPEDGLAWEDRAEEGVHRVVRGGSYWNVSQYCRAAYRFHPHPAYAHRSLGFRLAASFQAADLTTPANP